MHRDLKPQNILINQTGEIKLCDFGEARRVVDFASSTDGTILYMAPERFQLDRRYNGRAETWSLAMTLVEIALGKAFRNFLGQ